jgi:hypothetical protein
LDGQGSLFRRHGSRSHRRVQGSAWPIGNRSRFMLSHASITTRLISTPQSIPLRKTPPSARAGALLARVQLSAEYLFPSELVDRAPPQHQGIADAKLVASERPRRQRHQCRDGRAQRHLAHYLAAGPLRIGGRAVRLPHSAK